MKKLIAVAAVCVAALLAGWSWDGIAQANSSWVAPSDPGIACNAYTQGWVIGNLMCYYGHWVSLG